MNINSLKDKESIKNYFSQVKPQILDIFKFISDLTGQITFKIKGKEYKLYPYTKAYCTEWRFKGTYTMAFIEVSTVADSYRFLFCNNLLNIKIKYNEHAKQKWVFSYNNLIDKLNMEDDEYENPIELLDEYISSLAFDKINNNYYF